MTFHLSNEVFFTRVDDMVKIEKKRLRTHDPSTTADDELEVVFESFIDMDSFFSMVALMTGKDFEEVKDSLGG
jgi:hypothetical protein